jgi:hypothetical protein
LPLGEGDFRHQQPDERIMLNRLKTVVRDIRVTRGGRRSNRQSEFVPLIFRRRRGATVTQHHQWHGPVFLRLEIERPMVTMASPVVRLAPPAALPVFEQVSRRDEVIERVVRRQIRLEAGAASPDQPFGSRAPTGVLAAPASAPMILRAAPPVPAGTAAAPPANVAGDLPRMPARPAKADANAIDINRLTEQVVTAIDRRISAWRERTGRL